MLRKTIADDKLCLIALLCVLLCAPFAANAQQYIRFVRVYGRNYVYLDDVAKYYGMTLVKGQQECELRSKYSKIVFTMDKRSAEFNTVRINFLYAPMYHKGSPMMSQLDFSLVLDPMLRKAAVPRQLVKKIMIDPGHGGKDNGAAGKRYREKDLVLQISRRLRDALKGSGFEVVMTRDSDVFLSLQERAALCVKHQPDIFLSIHCNSASAESVSGIETFCLTPAGAPSTSDTNASDAIEAGNSYDKSNARLALEVQRHLLVATGARDRGVKHARFHVLRNASCPSALVEVGFLSNAAEERLLGSPAHQQKIAEGIAKAVAAYSDVVKP